MFSVIFPLIQNKNLMENLKIFSVQIYEQEPLDLLL